VYDTVTGLSWPLYANLAAHNNFGFTGTIELTSDVNKMDLILPMIDKDGAVYFSALCAPAIPGGDPCPPPPAGGWVVSMNSKAYAGSSNWKVPDHTDLMQLYQDLNLQAGDTRLESQGFVGPFWRLQPGFYWACPRDPGSVAQAPCDFSPDIMPGNPDDPMAFSFNFDDGFLGTDHLSKQFYVMVYFPAP
jgi:hypothetical protein